jgi:hypothetical protein
MAYKQKNNPFVKASPNKFIGKALKGLAGGLGKAALGGIGNLLGGSKLFGGRRRGGDVASINPDTMTPNNPLPIANMSGGPFSKKDKKYKKKK